MSQRRLRIGFIGLFAVASGALLLGACSSRGRSPAQAISPTATATCSSHGYGAGCPGTAHTL